MSLDPLSPQGVLGRVMNRSGKTRDPDPARTAALEEFVAAVRAGVSVMEALRALDGE